MTDSNRLHGVVVPIITPVDDDDRVDEAAFRKAIRYLIDAGVHSLFVGGSAGEGPLFTMTEWVRLMEIALDENGGAIPLLGGVMDTSTRRVIEKIRVLNDIGYENYAVSPTYYIALHSSEEHLRLFGACKEAAPDMEMVVYNIPTCTGSTVSVAAFLEMARRGWLRYCKESSGDLVSLLALIKRGRDLGLMVLVGEERLMYEGLLAGGAGMVPVGANYEPETYIRIYNAALRGDEEELSSRVERARYVCETLTGGTCWLAGIKYALTQRGIGSGRPLSPLEPTDEDRKRLIDGMTPPGDVTRASPPLVAECPDCSSCGAC